MMHGQTVVGTPYVVNAGQEYPQFPANTGAVQYGQMPMMPMETTRLVQPDAVQMSPEMGMGMAEPATAMPMAADDAAQEPAAADFFKWTVGPLVPAAIGLGIAFLIYEFGNTERYRFVIDGMEDCAYFFLGIYIFCRMVVFLNMYPMAYKNNVLTREKENVRANAALFRVLGSNQNVVMAEDGTAGQYNRANRSLSNFVEHSLGLVLALATIGWIYPVATFVILLVLSVARVWHQVGYIDKYGAHGPGFLFSFLAAETAYGLVLVAAIRGFGHL